MPFFLHPDTIDVAACLDAYARRLPTCDSDNSFSHDGSRTQWYTLHWPDSRAPLWACGRFCVACCRDAWMTHLDINAWTLTPEHSVTIFTAIRGTADPEPLPYFGVYASPARAHQARKLFPESSIVSFAVSAPEAEEWRARERERLSSFAGVYNVPWADETWQIALDELHYAYLSCEKPGLIAYTPSEEWGVTDRQLRVRPGRYLEQFAPHLTTRERDAYCAQVKAQNDRNILRFAITARDIQTVFQAGPSSCMSHANSDFASSSHPTIAYADSPDLQLAYLGEVGNLDDKIRGRAIVWPERKLHSRVYGDTTITYLLKQAGYTLGTMAGARLQMIADENGNDYIMPFIDGCASCSLTRDEHGKRFFVLHEDDDGDYPCQNTNGLTNDNVSHDDDEGQDGEYYSCAVCCNHVDEDGNVCRRCSRNRWVCTNCEDDSYETENIDTIDGFGDVCPRCYERLASQCFGCDETFFAVAFSDDETRVRTDANVSPILCLKCGERAMELQADEVRRAAVLYALETALNTRTA